MISCTEFIAAYSELFSFLEDSHGRREVTKLWEFLFAPTGKGIPLINYVKRDGIKGCYDYWAGTLSEEAAEFTMYLNEARGYFRLVMHRCPSKGRLLELRDKLGMTPYHDYCLHCDSYRSAVEEAGLKYIYDFSDVDRASCSLFIYDPRVFDGRIIVDGETAIMDRKAADNAYFHPDFHSSMNMGLQYLGENFGAGEVREYLTRYTDHVYRNVIADIRRRGLTAIKEKIEDTYRQERASDALKIELNQDSLRVSTAYCPAVKHLKETGRSVSPWFKYTTRTVMEELAGKGGYHFQMQSYDEETGAEQYRFFA